MDFCGIICEYNPFHYGHAYHLREARRLSGADTLVLAMSGNFTQRGEPAVADKYTRAKWAVLGGADIVVELPAVAATAPAADFALGAVRLLGRCGVKALCFGSECGTRARLNRLVADIDAANVAENLENGKSYAAAFAGTKNYTSNNILAAEYLRAIEKTGSAITPLTVKRSGAGYNEVFSGEYGAGISPAEYPSAAYIRGLLRGGEPDKLPASAPPYVLADLAVCPRAENTERAFFQCLGYGVLSGGIKLDAAAYLPEGLDKHVYNCVRDSYSYGELLSRLVTKRYPLSKIKRLLTAALLGITAEDADAAKREPPYAKILAVKRGRENVLRSLSGRLKTITRFADYAEFDSRSLRTDIFASEIYSKLTGIKINDLSSGLQKV
jgi:predicted nucleotidyltransferase